jgi:TM2 domain-containing membrane protein YozV
LASQVSGSMPPPPVAGAAPPPGGPVISEGSPGLAAILGFIPGVGAFYNGEYTKGFLHVLIFATLIWAADNVSGLFGLGIAAFVLYMPIEAYRTAKAKQMGVTPPDPFGFNNVNIFGGNKATPAAAAGQPGAQVSAEMVQEEAENSGSCVPAGALILIALGVIFLLNQFGWWHFDWFGRFWPLILIAVGVRVLMKRSGRTW